MKDSISQTTITLSALSRFSGSCFDIRVRQVKLPRDMRKQTLFFGIGIESFLLSFFISGFLASFLVDQGFVSDFGLEMYGLVRHAGFHGVSWVSHGSIPGVQCESARGAGARYRASYPYRFTALLCEVSNKLCVDIVTFSRFFSEACLFAR